MLTLLLVHFHYAFLAAGCTPYTTCAFVIIFLEQRSSKVCLVTEMEFGLYLYRHGHNTLATQVVKNVHINKIILTTKHSQTANQLITALN